jgi:hypothetical protein
MEQKIVDLEVIQTNTKSWKISFPFDISGYILFFTVKKNLNDTDINAVIEKRIDCPYNIDSQNGIVYLNLSTEDTNIDIGQYFYDIKIQQDASGGEVIKRNTVGTGTFRVNATITIRTV